MPAATHWWALLVLPIALLAATAHANWLLVAAGFHIYGIPSTSMEPTIDRGDHIVVDLRAYRDHPPVFGDIVVFHKDSQQLVKRVIAASGSTVQGKNGDVFLNGKRLTEPYVLHEGHPSDDLVNFGPITVPEGKLFVMGDNRDVSYDSRMVEFGLVDARRVVGRPLYIFKSERDRSGTSIH